MEGQSQLREIDRRSGRVLHRTVLPASSFGEGIAVHGERLFQLTWQDERGFTYDATSLSPVDSFTYTGEGWGLTSDGRRLYLSDGSSRIRMFVPSTMSVERTIEVKEAGRGVWMLNELEWIRGELWANIYQTSWIARIDPSTGVVLGWVDTSQLLTPTERADVAARGGTANGIAYDSVSNRVLLTGKRWPRIFETDLRKLAP
ncbi:MAG: glutaminyl-peptide cyclotransferase [Gemmatimonadaceae bacterium]|nr:glutaminyl-peptide cyclotransferase [Gemmatimonadaceae bacterium]